MAALALPVLAFVPGLDSAALPLVVLAASPLSMLLMMRTMRSMRSCDRRDEAGAPDEVARLRAEGRGSTPERERI